MFARMTLRELANTQWTGRGELWLDPLGNEVDTCECRIELEEAAIHYHWSYDGKPQTGKIALRDGGAEFSDSWHSPTPMAFVAGVNRWSLVDVFGTYAAGDGPDWGWRIILTHRPSDELVLQMTNVTPWGEEARAVRMVCSRDDG
jgi:hypothetical protein